MLFIGTKYQKFFSILKAIISVLLKFSFLRRSDLTEKREAKCPMIAPAGEINKASANFAESGCIALPLPSLSLSLSASSLFT